MTIQPDVTKKMLEKIFGFSSFREGQEEVITRVLNGKSVLSIFPTGSGKSLCYQLPALMLPGLTVVVSPLIALIDDQLSFLHSRNIPATKIDSTLTLHQAQQIRKDLVDQKYKILFVSVERFKNERFRRFLHTLSLSLLVVDEAHCISEWGHNFRPDYIKLPVYKEEFGFPQALLLTATAPQKVQEDICRRFHIATDDVISTGFYRPNLNLRVLGVEADQKIDTIAKLLTAKPTDPTIIYVTLQETAVTVATQLVTQGFNARPYHAGLSSEIRMQTQQAFMQGKCDIIVATIAFGMGIDKANIRRVIHYDLPKSLEGLSQEIGRAGRDGKSSDCTILGNLDHIQTLENFVYGDTPSRDTISSLVHKILESAPTWETNIYQCSVRQNIRQLPLRTALVYLEALDIITPTHSYYAEYRFKTNQTPQEIVSHFKGERATFIKNIFSYSDKARIWYDVNFEKIAKADANADRERVIHALEYFSDKEWIQLETKRMMEVFSVHPPEQCDIEKLVDHLYQLFENKESGEIFRIQQVVDLISASGCIYHKLTEYFGQETSWDQCGHCSNCLNETVPIPPRKVNEDFSPHQYAEIKDRFLEVFKAPFSKHDMACYLCGISTPLLARYRLKKSTYWSIFALYRYHKVMEWINENEQ